MSPTAEADQVTTNRAVVEDFARLFYGERDVPTAFEAHVAVDYIQHNPRFADGRDAAVEGLTPMFQAPGSRFEVQRILVDGDLAAIHLRAQPEGRPPLSVIDIYRLDGGRIVEHWDVLQPVPEESANPHPMF